jgi:hypothetical protein
MSMHPSSAGSQPETRRGIRTGTSVSDRRFHDASDDPRARWTAGCGDDAKSDADAGTDAGTDADTDSDSDADTDWDTDIDTEFNPEDPGIHVFLTMGSMYMMSTPMALALGGFMPAAREDFDPPEDVTEIPLDTCVVVADQPAPVPQCETDEDCYPEQVCLPEYDDNNQPIAGTEHCVTPRELMDVGPFTMEGFVGGPLTFSYNPNQSGAYTTANPGDGQVPPDALAFDTTYVFEGDGDPAQGLGPFHGEIYVAPEIELTTPPMVELPMGDLLGIEVDPSQDLMLEWTGENADGELTLNLAGGPQGGGTPIECRVADDGQFVIPQAMVQTAGLGSVAFFNMLTIDRGGAGWVSGEGVTFHNVEMVQTLLLNVVKVGE